MKNGEIYRGLLLSAEDTMNMTLSDVLRTARNGQITKLPTVYLRGSSVRFIALPELLKNAPVFQKVTTMKRKMEQEQKQRQQKQQGRCLFFAPLSSSPLCLPWGPAFGSAKMKEIFLSSSRTRSILLLVRHTSELGEVVCFFANVLPLSSLCNGMQGRKGNAGIKKNAPSIEWVSTRVPQGTEQVGLNRLELFLLLLL
jgi:LSM domain